MITARVTDGDMPVTAANNHKTAIMHNGNARRSRDDSLSGRNSKEQNAASMPTCRPLRASTCAMPAEAKLSRTSLSRYSGLPVTVVTRNSFVAPESLLRNISDEMCSRNDTNFMRHAGDVSTRIMFSGFAVACAHMPCLASIPAVLSCRGTCST